MATTAPAILMHVSQHIKDLRSHTAQERCSLTTHKVPLSHREKKVHSGSLGHLWAFLPSVLLLSCHIKKQGTNLKRHFSQKWYFGYFIILYSFIHIIRLKVEWCGLYTTSSKWCSNFYFESSVPLNIRSGIINTLPKRHFSSYSLL